MFVTRRIKIWGIRTNLPDLFQKLSREEGVSQDVFRHSRRKILFFSFRPCEQKESCSALPCDPDDLAPGNAGDLVVHDRKVECFTRQTGKRLDPVKGRYRVKALQAKNLADAQEKIPVGKRK